MKNGSLITKCGFVLLILGGLCIAFILLSVLIAGSWSKTPEIVQVWGSILRPIGDIPIIGNFTFVLWGVFLIPGYLILLMGRKFEDSKLGQHKLNQAMLQPTSASSEKIEKDKLREERPFKVFVDDNFNYMDDSERYQQGEYKTEEEAISVCKQIVDDYLLGAYQPGMTAEQLCESYVNFGEDPFIRGVSKENSFSAWDYAQKRAVEILEERSQALKQNSNKDEAVNFWKYELDHKYGLLLPESEIMEDENRLYFYQTKRKKLCAAWDIKKKTWEVNLDRSLLEGLSFSTPKRFEQAVFDEKTNDEGYLRKQYLTEYLLLGIEAGEIKRLTKEVNNGAKIEFSVGAETWNEMLIGNSVVIEGGMCKFFERDAKDERILHFGMLCENWDVTIEFILGDYEEYEQHTFGIKAFDGYYN